MRNAIYELLDIGRTRSPVIHLGWRLYDAGLARLSNALFLAGCRSPFHAGFWSRRAPGIPTARYPMSAERLQPNISNRRPERIVWKRLTQ